MKGFYQGKATIKRVISYEVNEIGEQNPIYSDVCKADIRICSKVSQYVRTEAGFEKQNLWEAQVKAKTDVRQGDKISYKDNEYHVIGVDDDGSGVFLKLTLE